MIKFNNVNPSLLLKEFNMAGIKINIIYSNLKMGETIATKAWCDELNDVDINKVNEIIEHHNPNRVEEKQLSGQELLIANLIKSNAEQQNINAELIKQIAELKEGLINE